MAGVKQAVLLILLAGCLQGQAPDGVMPTADASNVTWIPFEASHCQTLTAFMLVEPSVSAEWLPPGFLPRGLDDFQPFTPVMFGKVPAFVATIHCEDTTLHNASVQTAMMGFRVFAPDFSDRDLHERLRQPATYDFYSVQFWSGSEPETQFFEGLGWPVEQVFQEVDLVPITDEGPVPAPVRNVVTGSHTINDVPWDTSDPLNGLEDIWYIGNTMGGYVDENIPGDAIIRFWHRTDAGLGFSEFQLQDDMEPTAGTLQCSVAAGSPVDQLTKRSAEGRVDDAACFPIDSFTLTFPEHNLAGGFLLLDGVFRV